MFIIGKLYETISLCLCQLFFSSSTSLFPDSIRRDFCPSALPIIQWDEAKKIDIILFIYQWTIGMEQALESSISDMKG